MEAFLAKLLNALADGGFDAVLGHQGTDVFIKLDRADSQRLIDLLSEADRGIVWYNP